MVEKVNSFEESSHVYSSVTVANKTSKHIGTIHQDNYQYINASLKPGPSKYSRDFCLIFFFTMQTFYLSFLTASLL